MRIAPIALFAALLAVLPATPGRAFSDAQLIDGFNRTVFGSEYPTFGHQSSIVKKFVNTARVYVDDRSREQRGTEVATFIRSLPSLIKGLKLTVVSRPGEANYRVIVLDRPDYRRVVSQEVYGRPTSSFAPGRCIVRVVSNDKGIIRSDAVVVADEGDFLFHRCSVEEVLQGLGPVNDDRTLYASVFNDTSRHHTFTSFDRHILNMLYHPLIRPGMTMQQAQQVLPLVVRDVQARLP